MAPPAILISVSAGSILTCNRLSATFTTREERNTRSGRRPEPWPTTCLHSGMEPLVHWQIMKFTQYFQAMRQRPDRATIELEWIQRVVKNPVKEFIQKDGRIRRWAPISEAEERYLRVVLLPDGETVHNAFFDRRFMP